MMNRPWLSVIVPACDGSRFVRQALDSVLAQGEYSAEVEVIVVDDGSSDDTLEIVHGYEGRLALVVERRRHGGNWMANANHGMRLARGQYISILHQDDLWGRSRLRVLRRFTARYPSATIYVHPCWFADAAGRRIGYWHCPFPRHATLLAPRQVVPQLLVQCFYGMPSPLFSAEAARQVGLMDESLWFSADWDFWLKLSRFGTTVYCPIPLATFRLHSASQTIARGRYTDEIQRQQLAVLERHRQALGSEVVPPVVWRVARFSTDVNAALVRLLDGRPVDFSRLAIEFCALGPHGWARYFRDSRVLERCLSRVQAGAVCWRSGASGASPRRLLTSAARRLPPFSRAMWQDQAPLVSGR